MAKADMRKRWPIVRGRDMYACSTVCKLMHTVACSCNCNVMHNSRNRCTKLHIEIEIQNIIYRIVEKKRKMDVSFVLSKLVSVCNHFSSILHCHLLNMHYKLQFVDN